MLKAVFLSAGVPDERRGPEFARTARPVAIAAAVSALVYVTLGRRPLVWGGHPAITPLIWAMADALEVDYGEWVRLYQSDFFQDEYPEDNKKFKNVHFTPAVGSNREESLRMMRGRMIGGEPIDVAVFIGGMQGIIDEYRMISELKPKTKLYPIVSTGGAAAIVGQHAADVTTDLINDLDYVGLFHRILDIQPGAERLRMPPS